MSVKDRPHILKRFRILIIISAICFPLGLVLFQLVSGGEKLRNQVIDAARTNTGVVKCFGTISEIRRSSDGERVDLDFDGNRTGVFSLFVQGSQTNGEIQVDWAKTATNNVEITKVSRVLTSGDKEPLWPMPAH